MPTEQCAQQKKEKELIENCDAVVWALVEQEEEEARTLMNFYRAQTKVKPTELGYKYNILQFRVGDTSSIEVFSAIIGDQLGYVERMGKCGYNGIMIKQKSVNKKEIKNVFKNSLLNWGFQETEIHSILKQLV
jgi:protein-arginine kinase